MRNDLRSAGVPHLRPQHEDELKTLSHTLQLPAYTSLRNQVRILPEPDGVGEGGALSGTLRPLGYLNALRSTAAQVLRYAELANQMMDEAEQRIQAEQQGQESEVAEAVTGLESTLTRLLELMPLSPAKIDA